MEERVSCDNIHNCRTLSGIVLPCLATIVLSTWASVHPNIPPPNLSKLARAISWRRICLLLVAVIAPELMVGLAARQFLDARWLSKEYVRSKTHAFFITMGGFVTRIGHHPIVTPDQLEKHPEYVTDIQSVQVKTILDKSKGSKIPKVIGFLEGLWFSTRCLARVHQHLPLTTLEVATLAFQFVSIFMSFFWWNKPFDVEEAIMVPIGTGHTSIAGGPPPMPFWEAIGATISGLVLGTFPSFNPKTSISVPAFWSTHGSNKRDTHLISIVIQTIVGTAFGVIHLMAWNAHFPSEPEMLLWRIFSPMMTVLAFALTLVYLPMLWYDPSDLYWKVLDVSLFISIILYFAARFVLIALPITTLRDLPYDVFVSVDWGVYIRL